jgi:hypothetical protein
MNIKDDEQECKLKTKTRDTYFMTDVDLLDINKQNLPFLYIGGAC